VSTVSTVSRGDLAFWSVHVESSHGETAASQSSGKSACRWWPPSARIARLQLGWVASAATPVTASPTCARPRPHRGPATRARRGQCARSCRSPGRRCHAETTIHGPSSPARRPSSSTPATTTTSRSTSPSSRPVTAPVRARCGREGRSIPSARVPATELGPPAARRRRPSSGRRRCHPARSSAQATPPPGAVGLGAPAPLNGTQRLWPPGGRRLANGTNR
jgi:hypothetical protein